MDTIRKADYVSRARRPGVLTRKWRVDVGEGYATPIVIGTPGENAVRTFPATAGQQITLSVTGNTIEFFVRVEEVRAEAHPVAVQTRDDPFLGEDPNGVGRRRRPGEHASETDPGHSAQGEQRR